MIIAGTGHRPDKLLIPGVGPYEQEHHRIVTRFAEQVLTSHAGEIRKVISGGAQGWDLALAQAAVHLDIPLHMAVPFKGQESRWPKETQLLYRGLMDAAEKVTIVSPGGFSAYKMQIRNEWMCKQSYLLLALHDGTLGGTANCLEYAESIDRAYINYWDAWKAYIKEESK